MKRPANGPVAAAHRATVLTFALDGLILASWLSRIATVKESAGLSTGGLGTVLAAPVVAGLLFMQVSTPLLARLGSRTVVRLCLPGTALSLAAIGYAQSVTALVVALCCYGVIGALLYVAMHTQGVRVEASSGRTRMNAYHAAWSLGALAGACGGAAFAWAGAGVGVQYLVVAVVCVVLSAATAGDLLAEPPAHSTGAGPGAGHERRGRRGGWSRDVVVLGAMGLCCLVVQGGVQDWGAVFLHSERDAAPGIASLGYVGFSAALVLVRLVGDRLAGRYGEALLLRGFAWLAVAGMLVAVLAPWTWLAVAGFAVVGAGVSILDPLVSSAAGRLGADPSGATRTTARNVAQVASLGHLGVLLGPPFIGWLSELMGLGSALVVAGLLLLPGVVLAAGRVKVWREPLPTGPAAAAPGPPRAADGGARQAGRQPAGGIGGRPGGPVPARAPGG
ncbi:MFS transporter [Streptomyces sp. NPDC088387]|uniref:MFS transporter n=1 Tax=Streptomyces sp. NPDC088387 TaxID=3365859 RepID=UPI0037FA112F